MSRIDRIDDYAGERVGLRADMDAVPILRP